MKGNKKLSSVIIIKYIIVLINIMGDKSIEDEILQLDYEIKRIIKEIKEQKELDPKFDDSSLRNELWELSKKKFILKSKYDSNFKRYQGIIFTVGFSPEPIILNILVNEPDYVFFIYTKESEIYIDKIIEETNLKPSQFQKAQMLRDSAADSYKLVKRGFRYLTEDKCIPKKGIALDPTGGTKIMSVGCGIAASIFDIDILYINNERYNKELRRPEPGSEILVRVPNPFDIYQDDKILEGLNYLNSLDFALARDFFYNIKKSSTNPLFPEFLGVIANILYQWDSISYNEALKLINRAEDLLNKLTIKLELSTKHFLRIFEGWSNYLAEINDKIENNQLEVEKISPLLIFDIKQNADREFHKNNYNNAALKYYRTIEMINQYILWNKYNINTQEPKYSDIPLKNIKILNEYCEKNNLNIENAILEQYNQIWKEIYEKQNKLGEYKPNTLLPRKIGLIAGLIIRNILGDPQIDRNFIFNALTVIENRNNSIFAHGIASINKKNCEKLKKYAEYLIKDIEIDSKLSSLIFTEKNIKSLTEIIKKII
ncbi:MAG: TIGR02710 family CRISPR-associated CARF protein [Promethearchaeota archaeon]